MLRCRRLPMVVVRRRPIILCVAPVLTCAALFLIGTFLGFVLRTEEQAAADRIDATHRHVRQPREHHDGHDAWVAANAVQSAHAACYLRSRIAGIMPATRGPIRRRTFSVPGIRSESFPRARIRGGRAFVE